MQKHILALTAAAFILGYGATAATAQGPMMGQPAQPQGQGVSGGGQAYDGGWGYGRWHMMRGGFTGGPGMMGNPIMMRMIFALIDTDGDGAISLQEFQAAHERIFKAMDTNKDGRLTFEEMQTFMHGTATPAQPR
jgi:EF hand domain-containing protein